MKNLFQYTREKLATLLVDEYNQKAFRATQLFTWIYLKGATSFDQMSDVSKDFRAVLKRDFSLEKPTIFTKEESKDGTIKFLVELADHNLVETVIMPYRYGHVLCVSSQVGCNMGCAFCASGLLKKKRNLTTDEMVGELLLANEILKPTKAKISHVVVMGTGEPFDNYENVMDFIRIVNDPKAFEIGARHITVSTSGIVDKMRQYAREGLQINLAISLHAPTDKQRDQLMKINKRYPLKELMAATKDYVKIAGRRVTFEYILLKGVNDSYEDAVALAKLIKGILAYVNLIPYNEVKENPFKRSDKARIHQFLDWLTKLGVHAQIRKEFGSDISAACGQLRAKVKHG
ncbi:MAG: 23S rRNA (adenine(2503)-C(2))-methyltransferase RlmN [Bacilli bacterium]|nr:23S rRNA (adenine(2503)-C(2))-methyltransferase RlmN [Bacilli bacterium]